MLKICVHCDSRHAALHVVMQLQAQRQLVLDNVRSLSAFPQLGMYHRCIWNTETSHRRTDFYGDGEEPHPMTTGASLTVLVTCEVTLVNPRNEQRQGLLVAARGARFWHW